MFTTCSVSPEETPGLCSLSCGSAKIGGSDPTMKIVANSPVTQSFTCNAGSANQPINPTLIYFTVAKSIEEVRNDGAADNPVEATTYNQPVPFVSIEPVVNGLLSDEDSDNPNAPRVDGVRRPIRYQGVATPASDWCSDSCGVVGVEVAFRCPGVGETQVNTVQVHSGALFSEPVSITVQTQAAN